jgi:hypothetical protein
MWANEQRKRAETSIIEAYPNPYKRRQNPVKKPIYLLSCLLLAGWALAAAAQSVWTYEVLGANNQSTIDTKPPMDISYPPGNARAPIYTAAEMPRGTILTSQQAAARLNAPKLIIILGPVR